MPQPLGSEEFYRGSPQFQQGYTDYTPTTLDLMNKITARKLQQMGDIGESAAEVPRQSGQFFQQMAEKAPKVYEQTEEYTRGKRENEQKFAADQQEQALRTEDIRNAMELAKKQRAQEGGLIDYRSGSEEGASQPRYISEYEQKRQADLANTQLNAAATRANIAATTTGTANAKAQGQRSAEDHNIDLLKTQFIQAAQAGASPESVYETGAQMGMSNAAIKQAEGQATAARTGARTTQNLEFAGTHMGEVATGKLAETSAKLSGLGKLIAAKNEYENTGFTQKAGRQIGITTDAKIAQDKAVQALREMGEPVEQLTEVSPSNQVDRMQDAIDRAKAEITKNLNLLKANYESTGGPTFKVQIDDLKKSLDKINQLSNSELDPYSGQQAPANQTQLYKAATNKALRGDIGGGFAQPVQNPGIAPVQGNGNTSPFRQFMVK